MQQAIMDKKTVLIIETVKNYPVLYDIFHTDHKNRKVINEIWENIAEMIEELNGDVVKNRWKNLKDAYAKCLRANKSSPVPKNVQRYKFWPWKEHMSFLQPYITYSMFDLDTEIKIEPKSADPLQDESLQNPHCSIQEIGYKIKEQSTSTPFNQLYYSRKRTSYNSDSDSQADEASTILDNKNGIDHDATDLIFLGYARTIKNMSKRRQATVKFRIAKLIMEAELDQAEET